MDGEEAYCLYADDMGEAWNDVLARLFDGSINLALHDAKDTIKLLLQSGLDPRGISFDTALAAYLIDPTQSSYELPRLALACCNAMLPDLDLDDPAALSPLGGRETTEGAAARYLAAMREIFREMNDKIEQFGMRKLYYEIELPLERVLAEMENAGCAVAPEELRTFGERLETRIRDLVDGIYQDAKGDTIKAFLAVYDNLERAAAAEGGEDDPHKKGLEMIFHQFKELLAKEGVKEIEAKGKTFDPETMNAVMHIDDETLGENEVAQVFQAGFELNGKVLRHAIVQVAN